MSSPFHERDPDRRKARSPVGDGWWPLPSYVMYPLDMSYDHAGYCHRMEHLPCMCHAAGAGSLLRMLCMAHADGERQ